MPSAKTSAKKTPPKKSAGTVQSAKVKLPAGYKVIANSEYAQDVDWNTQDQVEGLVVEIKTVIVDKGKPKEKEARIMVIEQADKSLISIWEKVQLTPLFDAVKTGKSRVCIMMLGRSPSKKGHQPMYNFACGIK